MGRVLFISDLHLDPAQPEIARQFLDFLGCLGLLARLATRLYGIAAVVLAIITGIGRFQLLAVILVGAFQVVLFQFFVAHVLPHDLRKAGYL